MFVAVVSRRRPRSRQMITDDALERLKGSGQDDVRRYVHDTLLAAPSFGQLKKEDQRAIAQNLVKVIGYLTHPAGGDDKLKAKAKAMGVKTEHDPIDVGMVTGLEDGKKKDGFGPAAQTAPDVFKRMVDSV